ncbi:MAG: oligosaccharide flippase family protein [Rhizobiales bacterium]|nr:oligosaccharide flippase family protein [Hyphomicrobiales bacterium]
MEKLRQLATRPGILAGSRFLGAGVGFLTQLIMARVLGASELGIFYAATSLAAVAGIAAAQGYPQIAPRFAARYRNKATPALFGRFAGQATLDAIFASAVALVLIAAYAMLWPSLSAIERSSYVAGGVMVVAVALINIYTNIAGAMRFFGICYVPEGLGRPILFFSAIAGISLLGLRPTAFVATALFAGATALIAVYVIRHSGGRAVPALGRGRGLRAVPEARPAGRLFRADRPADGGARYRRCPPCGRQPGAAPGAVALDRHAVCPDGGRTRRRRGSRSRTSLDVRSAVRRRPLGSDHSDR